MHQSKSSPSGELSPQAAEDVRPASTFSQPRSPFPPGIRHMNPSHMYDMDEVESMIFDYEGKLDILTKENDRLAGRNKYLLSQLGEVRIKCKNLEEDLGFYKQELSEANETLEQSLRLHKAQDFLISSYHETRKRELRNRSLSTALITAFVSIVLTTCVCLILSGGAL